MDKNQRHLIAESFRKKITMPVQRNYIIGEFLSKESFSEKDKLRLSLLFQKKEYLQECENAYRRLISKIKVDGDPQLVKKTEDFFSCLSVKTDEK